MTSCVVDACMFGPLILPDEAGEIHEALLTLLSEGVAVVPGNWRLEVANLGRMGVRKRRIKPDELRNALALIRGFTVIIDEETNAHAWDRVIDLSETHDLTMYDAAYLELSLRRKLPLLTRDAALGRAAEAEGIITL